MRWLGTKYINEINRNACYSALLLFTWTGRNFLHVVSGINVNKTIQKTILFRTEITIFKISIRIRWLHMRTILI